MDKGMLLPNSQYIDTDLGLKYLNGNRKLYLKVLNSFLSRYIYFDIYTLNKNEFNNEMHTLKGLSSTLGMVSLSTLAKNLYSEQNEELLFKFSEMLTLIIKELDALKTVTLLIINDNSDEIDSIIEVLDDSYDIIVISTTNDDLEILNIENIDIALLGQTFNTPYTKNKLKQKNVSIIELSKPIVINNILKAIKSSQN